MRPLRQHAKSLAVTATTSLLSFCSSSLTGWLLNRYLYRPVINSKGAEREPIPLFDTVFFEVRTRCNGRCSFCLASVETDPREDISMSPELYEKILFDLSEVGYDGRIAFHNNSEPLLFKDLAEYVSKAKQYLPHCFVQILTNGKSLNVKRAKELIDAGVDQIAINVYGDSIDGEVPNVIHKIVNEVLNQKFRKNELEIIGLDKDHRPKNWKFSFIVNKRLEEEILDSRAGTAPNKKQPVELPRGFCQYPFTQFIVTADGTVAGCCNDVLFSLPMGNVSTETVSEIWNGEKFRALRKHLLGGDRGKVSTCKECDFMGVKKAPNNILARLLYTVVRGRG